MRRKIVAVIPARGGSKGIPRKNLALLAGKPLIWYSIQSAKESGLFDEILVSSDDDEILQLAISEKVLAQKRPLTLAQDLTTSNEVINFIIEENKYEKSDLICLLQPTSPFRTAIHIKNAFSIRNEHSTVISVKKQNKSVYKTFLLGEDGFLQGLVSSEAPFIPRQLIPDLYLPNGAIYIFSVEKFIESKNKIPQTNIVPFVMEDIESIDIDSSEDLIMANQILESK
ncbi:acylneuraminate cytidylyltransferase family protein [uncultured Shewanella sp.]|uniref:acylneuraminate cytidylyltransferase family protein n=1 Tax=uncultured Shewanella sp. TaxID=173975 RepID=UPI002605892D|nr:acylneuraminate cytidylyltransferase family protein [uncultured Shewanella sp.]